MATLVRIVMWLMLAAVAAAAAVLSFTALRDLGVDVGYVGLAWLLPVSIDAGAAVSCLVWLGKVPGTTAPARRNAMLLTWSLLAGSVAGNAVEHVLSTYALVPTWWLVVLVTAVPPAVLGSVVHLAVHLGRAELPTLVQYVEMAGLAPEAGELAERARGLIEAGAGRPTLIRELGIKDNQAKKLLRAVRQPTTEAPA